MQKHNIYQNEYATQHDLMLMTSFAKFYNSPSSTAYLGAAADLNESVIPRDPEASELGTAEETYGVGRRHRRADDVTNVSVVEQCHLMR